MFAQVLENFASNKLPIEEPEMRGHCRFKRKQCGPEKCYCVDRKTGLRRWPDFEIPLDDDCWKCYRKNLELNVQIFHLKEFF